MPFGHAATAVLGVAVAPTRSVKRNPETASVVYAEWVDTTSAGSLAERLNAAHLSATERLDLVGAAGTLYTSERILIQPSPHPRCFNPS